MSVNLVNYTIQDLKRLVFDSCEEYHKKKREESYKEPTQNTRKISYFYRGLKITKIIKGENKGKIVIKDTTNNNYKELIEHKYLLYLIHQDLEREKSEL